MKIALAAFAAALFLTAVVIFVNYVNRGADAILSDIFVYVGYFVTIFAVIAVSAILFKRFGGS